MKSLYWLAAITVVFAVAARAGNTGKITGFVKDSQTGFLKMFFLEPLLRFTILISLFKTALTNKIVWSGITYHLTFSGIVAKVERPDGN